MLVASIVHLTLGLKDHRVVATEMVGNELHFHLDAKRNRKLTVSQKPAPPPLGTL